MTESAEKNTAVKERDPDAKARQMAGLRPWKKGQSGNPGGRATTHKTKMKALAERRSYKAMRTICQIAEDPNAPAGTRLAAANDILCWAYGKPEVQANIKAEVNVNATSEIALILKAIENDHDNPQAIDVTPEIAPMIEHERDNESNVAPDIEGKSEGEGDQPLVRTITPSSTPQPANISDLIPCDEPSSGEGA